MLVQRRRGDPARKGTAGANETICVEEDQGELCSDVGWGDEIDAVPAREKIATAAEARVANCAQRHAAGFTLRKIDPPYTPAKRKN